MLEEMTLNPITQLIGLAIGIAALILGRKLFWLAVGTVGFVIGLALAVEFLREQPDWVILVAALAIGFLGALLAVFVQKIAVVIAGFAMGGYGLVWLVTLLSLNLERWEWLLFIIGGVLGALLAATLFEAALIILSSLAGAALIVELTNFSPLVDAILFLILMIIGVAVQVQMWQQDKIPTRT